MPGKADFVYNNRSTKSGSEKMTLDQSKEAFDKQFFNIEDLPKAFSNSDDVVKFVEKLFREKFNPDKVEDEFRAFAQKHAENSDEIDRYVRDTMKVYRKNFDQFRAQFYRKVEQKLSDAEDSIKKHIDATKKLTADLKQAFQNGLSARGAQSQVDEQVKKSPDPAKKEARIPIIGPILQGVNVPILSPILDSSEYRDYREFQRETTRKFKEFLGALNTKYFNLEWQEKHLSKDQMARYGKLADKFKSGMEKYVENQLEYILENSHDKQTVVTRLQGLRDVMTKNYTNNSNNQGFIDLPKLEKLHADSKNVDNIMRMLNGGEDPEAIAKIFESSQFFNREMWTDAVKVITAQLIENAVANGSESSLIATVKKLTGSSKNMDIDEAKTKFKDLMEKRAKVGVKETLLALNEFSKITNGERSELLELNGIKPSLKPYVLREREYLLSRRAVPKNIDDRMVVEFMSTNLVGRRSMLADKTRRIALFQAIKNIQNNYPKLYRKQAASIPKEIHDKHYDISRPDTHDHVARIVALLTLSREAEWVIKNLDKSKDYKGEKLYGQFEDTPHEKNAPAPDLRFRDSKKLYKTGYISAAARGGFTAKDIGLLAVKGLIGLTIILNLLNARKAEGGWMEGIGNVITNPYILAGSGAYYGIKRYEENPEVATYLSQDEGGQRRIETSLGLTSLAKKQGRVEVMDFINNGDEFRAMKHIMKNPTGGARKVKKMLRAADKQYAEGAKARSKALAKDKTRSTVSVVAGTVAKGLDFAEGAIKGTNPGEMELTKDIMKKYFTSEYDQYVLSQLPDNSTNNRMRYLFYQKFLTNPKVNMRELQSNCLKWA